MKRSHFLLIIAVLNGALALFMTLAPAKAAEVFGIANSPHTTTLLRGIGTLILSLSVLNFLVRNEPDSPAFRAVLIANLIGAGLGVVFNVMDMVNGVTEIAKVAPGTAVPLITTVASLYYLMKMKKTA